MRPCVVLVDYENVQPTEFVEVAQAGCHVWFFVGSSQKRVSTDLPDFIARFPAQSRFIRMEKPGKNSLDFHICYYLGVAAHERPEWLYVLMSKDTGYDPLLAHVRNEGMFAQRVVTIPQLHALLGIGSASRAEVGEVAPKAAPRPSRDGCSRCRDEGGVCAQACTGARSQACTGARSQACRSSQTRTGARSQACTGARTQAGSWRSARSQACTGACSARSQTRTGARSARSQACIGARSARSQTRIGARSACTGAYSLRWRWWTPWLLPRAPRSAPRSWSSLVFVLEAERLLRVDGGLLSWVAPEP